MRAKTLVSLIIIILGFLSIGTSMYINSEVTQGKGKISRAEKKVNQGNQLFSLNPVTKEVGQGLTGAAQKKINAGKEEVAYYEGISQIAQITGIVLLVVGFGCLICCRKRKK